MERADDAFVAAVEDALSERGAGRRLGVLTGHGHLLAGQEAMVAGVVGVVSLVEDGSLTAPIDAAGAGEEVGHQLSLATE